jgi:hypothetical protein
MLFARIHTQRGEPRQSFFSRLIIMKKVLRIDNSALYETSSLVNKYAANTTRTRCLNNAEKQFIRGNGHKARETTEVWPRQALS